MSGSKKVFFGTLFEFSAIGAQDVLDKLCDQYDDPESVPFVSYDNTTNLFACEIHPTDQDLIPIINFQIDSCTTLYGRKPYEPFESDRLRPIDGTTFRNEAVDIKRREVEQTPFFEIGSSSDEDEAGDGNQNEDVAFWKPLCGDISILSRDIAMEIADATNCTLMPDLVGRKIKLKHGNLQRGLSKLQTLEQVLTFSASHRCSLTAHVNASISLIASSASTKIKFMRPMQPLCGFDRIMLDAAQVPLHKTILLAEARFLRGLEWIKPVNLDLEDVSLTARRGLSGAFKKFRLPLIGDAKNAEPRPPSKDNSQDSGEIQRPNSPTKFLGQKDTERVEEWRGNVDPQAAPTLPPAEPLPEEEKKPGRRRVVVDSDDEDGNVSSPQTAPDPPPAETLPDGEKRSGRRRVVVDSDDEEEDDDDDDEVTDFSRQRNQLTTKVDGDEWFQKDQAAPDSQPPSPSSKPDKFPVKAESKSQSHTYSVKGKAKAWPNKPKSAIQSNNRFDLIDPDFDTGQRRSTSEDPSTEQSDNRTRQLNVTFKEPELSSDDIEAAAKSPNSKVKKSGSLSFDTSQHEYKNHVPRSIPASPRKPLAHSRNKSINSHYSPHADVAETVPTGQSLSSPQKHEIFNARGGYRGRGQHAHQRRQPDLIDITADQSSVQPVMPPPGLDYRSVNSPQSAGITAPLLPPPSPAAANPPREPKNHSDALRQSGSNDTYSTSGSGGYSPHPLEFTPQFTVPKRNINFLREQIGARLKAQMETDVEPDAESKDSPKGLSPNRIRKDDEYSTRKYHQTMSQKMAKPGKSKPNSEKQETKAEREARIAKAKAEAYGDIVPARPASSKPQSAVLQDEFSEVMSAKKRQLLKKNPALADLHQDVLAETAQQAAATRLVELWEPILQATRAFRGTLQAEIQLGQALVLRDSHLDDHRLYALKDWLQLLNSDSKGGTKVAFTNILTSNGQDIDRMLEIKAETDSSRLWDKNRPGPVSMAFEFACQDKSGVDFVLAIDQDGNHVLNKAQCTIGQIGLHAPSQIWDACATISGTMEVLHPSEEIIVGVEQLKQSLYVPGGHKAAVYYRLPANNAFTIRAITLKCVSVHDCLLPHRDNIQLRVTEVKVLAHSCNPIDKKLYRSYESSYEVMLVEGRIHYEVAITDKTLGNAFDANPGVEIGELASVNTSDGKILTTAQAHGLVEVVSFMLDRIDWAGASNIGTLRRIFDSAADQRASIAHTLPPNLSRNVVIPMGTTAPPTIAPATYQSHLSRVGGGMGTNIVTTEPVVRQLQGVRTNTAAELFQDPTTGDLFYFGVGGARVPVTDEQLEPSKIDGMGAVLPDDSASQIGDVKGKRAATSRKSRLSARDDKPAGFW